jgi:nitrate/nitrite-specific signal transduction histidine kinase
MSAAAIAAIVVTVVLVLALAFYLAWVVLLLHRLTDTLGKVQFGVAAIAHRVQPVEAIVVEVNDDLTAVAEALEQLATDLRGGQPARAS